MRRLRVFLSFAGVDRPLAERLRGDLEQRHVDSFVDMRDIAQAENTVLAINAALSQSDYYVLLWSRACAGRPWVDVEWSSAFALEVRARRAFLFVVRLDASPLPALLAPRRYLDAFDGQWAATVDGLVAAWRREWGMRRDGTPVLPAPCATVLQTGPGESPTVLLYIRNRALSVAHVLAVSEDATGADLDERVRAGLALQESVTDPALGVGLRFSYQLRYGDRQIPGEAKLGELGVADGADIELEVQIEQFTSAGPSSPVIYRDSSRGPDEPSRDLPPALRRRLVTTAFEHLMP